MAKQKRQTRRTRPESNGPPTDADREAIEDALKAAAGAPGEALAEARVDLVQLIREGIPAPEYVPGAEPYLRRGKRHLMPSPAGLGKSLVALVIGVDIVEAGGTVVILDVENGDDEYARRLEDVLAARESDGSLADACSERLRYHAWPKLRVNWAEDEWVAANAAADLVVLDSSRLALTMAELDEDHSGDYSRFANGLLIPLSRSDIATLVLDNTGHEAKNRARGTKAKDDLNEIVYLLTRATRFDREQTGAVKLVRRRERFADLPAELHVPLGGGVYGPVEVAGTEGEFRPTNLMERYSSIIEGRPGITAEVLYEEGGGKAKGRRKAVDLLAGEKYIDRRRVGREVQHHSVKPYREQDDPESPVYRQGYGVGPESGGSGPESGVKARPRTPAKTRRKKPRKQRS